MRAKMIWISVAAALALLLFVYFMGKRKGKRGKPAKLPNNGSGIPEGWSPDGIVSELYEELKGMDWRFANAASKHAVYGSLTALSPDQLAAVYNEFNRRYGKGSNGEYSETLYNWIAEDWWGNPEKTAALTYLKQNGLF